MTFFLKLFGSKKNPRVKSCQETRVGQISKNSSSFRFRKTDSMLVLYPWLLRNIEKKLLPRKELDFKSLIF